MNEQIGAIVLAIVVAVIIIVALTTTREGAKLKAHDFGFPTGRHYRRGRRRRHPYSSFHGWWPRYGYYPGWGHGGYPPYLYDGGYYDNNANSYNSNSCYSSSEYDHCAIGYDKTQKDTNKDGKIDGDDDWMCCHEDMF